MATNSEENHKSNTSLKSEAKTPTRERIDQLVNNETKSKESTSQLSQHQSVSNSQSQSRLQVHQQPIHSSQNSTPTIQTTSSNTQISSTSPPVPQGKNSLPPIQHPPSQQQQSRNQPQNSNNSQPTMSSKANSNASLLNGRRPHRLEPLDTSNSKSPSQSMVKPLHYYSGPNNTKSHESMKISKQNTSNSLDGNKKIIRWHLWWDRSQSNLRVPSYDLPSKQVPSKIGSLNNITYKPGGGNMSILNEKLQWNKRARIDHLAKGYRPGGGNMSILNEKLSWNTESKIGSLANVNHKPGGGNISIVDMPFDKSTARSKIDSGFVFEEVIVPTDYILNSPRPSHLDSLREPTTGRRSKA